MKNIIFLLVLVFFVNSNGFAQEAGNRIYGNQGGSNSLRKPNTNEGNLLTDFEDTFFQIEASVLINLQPDSFVVVFGVQKEASSAKESFQKVDDQIDDFINALSGIAITKNDIYIDFIAQNKVYDYRVEGDIAEQFLAGFETKKTVAVRYKNRDSFEKITRAAINQQIFDLIKVDYIVRDFDSIREKLFDQATKVIKSKESKYTSAFGMTIKPLALDVEKYDAFYPGERYESYKAFESGAASTTNYRDRKTIVTLRKNTTFYYEPINGSKFDKVLNPIGLEPTVQFTIYLRVKYKMI